MRHLLCLLTAIACIAVSARVQRDVEAAPRLHAARVLRDAGFQQEGYEEEWLPKGTSFHKTVAADGDVTVTLSFQDFNKRLISVRSTLRKHDIEDSKEEVGYTDKGLKEIDRKFARKGQAVYDKALLAFLKEHGFRLLKKDLAMVDVPDLVRRNKPRLNKFANTLAVSVGSDDPEAVISAATALVQTALGYKELPDVEHGVHIGTFHPPLQVLADGWGNCGSKTALLASILYNWDGVEAVGVSLPNHYLMGLLRNPQPGDVFLEHHGLQYVLIEPVGPAWLAPGRVAEETMNQINSLGDIPIQPFERG